MCWRGGDSERSGRRAAPARACAGRGEGRGRTGQGGIGAGPNGAGRHRGGIGRSRPLLAAARRIDGAPRPASPHLRHLLRLGVPAPNEAALLWRLRRAARRVAVAIALQPLAPVVAASGGRVALQAARRVAAAAAATVVAGAAGAAVAGAVAAGGGGRGRAAQQGVEPSQAAPHHAHLRHVLQALQAGKAVHTRSSGA